MHALGNPQDLEELLATRQNQPDRTGAGNGPSAERLDELEARIAALEERLARLE